MAEVDPIDAVTSLYFSYDEQEWDAVARFVRQGCDDVQFNYQLEWLIDPDTDPYRELKLEVIRKGKRGRPKKNPDSIGKDEHIHEAICKLATSDKNEGLRQIASLINSGTGDQVFRNNVADMFDTSSKGPLGLKFKLKRFAQGQPRSARKRDIQNFLETQIDVLCQKQVLVFEEAARRFHIDVDTAEQYFKERRRKAGS